MHPHSEATAEPRACSAVLGDGTAGREAPKSCASHLASPWRICPLPAFPRGCSTALMFRSKILQPPCTGPKRWVRAPADPQLPCGMWLVLLHPAALLLFRERRFHACSQFGTRSEPVQAQIHHLHHLKQSQEPRGFYFQTVRGRRDYCLAWREVQDHYFCTTCTPTPPNSLPQHYPLPPAPTSMIPLGNAERDWGGGFR